MNEFEKLSEERKQLQQENEVPSWMTTQGWIMFKRKYAYNNETVAGAFHRIAKHLSQYYTENKMGAYEKFFGLMWSGKLAPSTPVYCNTGTDRGMSVSCAGSYIGDSVEQFYDGYSEIAILSKNGFGTASYLGDIRHRGASVSTGGKADGIVPVFDSCIDVMTKVSQGSNRRGQWAGYLPMMHEDFYELADYLQRNPADANIGWVVYDKDIDALRNNEKEAVARFNRIMYLRCRTGKGYIFKADTANNTAPDVIRNCGISIKSSQLCVAPETTLLTKNGHIEISTLDGQVVEVWNGTEWSFAKVEKTGEKVELLTITLSDGKTIDCTDYHKFYKVKGSRNNGEELVFAKDLKAGDRLIKFNTPVVCGEKELYLPYENGFFSGDGCQFGNKSIIYLYHEKRDLLKYFDSNAITYFTDQETQKRYIFHVSGLQEKFFIPDTSYTVDSKIKWLEGLFDADGVVCRNGNCQTLQFANTNREFLKQLQLMLQTLGVQSKVKRFADEGWRDMPANDGTGLLKQFWCKAAYRLLLTGTGIVRLQKLGFSPKRLRLTPHAPNRECSEYVRVVCVEQTGRVDATYCVNEPLKHKAIFNGILTGNCNEISLPSDKDHTFTCVLSSLNLMKWEDITDEDIYWSVAFLDCVCEDFIQQAKGVKHLERALRFSEKARALGLGTLGFHSLLQSRGIAFESFKAHMLNSQIYSRIRSEADKATVHLAKVFGEPEWCKGYGKRNATLMAIAPNLSSAVLCGGMSQGIEPWVSNTFLQQTAAGEFVRINPELLKILKERGVYSQELLDDINNNHQGSVQHLDCLTEQEKLVFKTAFEIDQKAIIRLASARQRYIDQGQSLNLFFSADEDELWIAEVHKEFLLDPFLKGLYYLRSERGVIASKGECVACEG